MHFEIRTFFYITASVAFILASLALIVFIVAAIQVQRTVKRTANRFSAMFDKTGSVMENMFYYWRRMSFTGIIMRALSRIFGR